MNPDASEQAQYYQGLVLHYEELGNQIQVLIEKNGGHTDKMPAADRDAYRQLANERDALYNEIKAIEAAWLSDE